MRQTYQLLMEDKTGTWRELDSGSDGLVWTCQANDIAELQDRDASYSQNLKLPKTAVNIEMFDYANHFDAVTVAPYRKHNCRVYCSGRAIAGKGSFLVLLKVSEYFECQILSGNASFFERLQDAPMSDLDLGVFQVCEASFDPATWHPAYRLAYGSDVMLPSYPYHPDATGIRYLKGAGSKYPVVSVDYILRAILLEHGYTFESNIDSWERMYLSVSSADVTPPVEDLAVLGMEIHTNGWSPITGSLPSVQYQWDVDADGDGHVIDNFPEETIIRYYIPPGQKVKFTITPSKAGTTMHWKLGYFFFKRGDETVHSGTVSFNGLGLANVWEYENESNVNDILSITATGDDEPLSGAWISIKGEVLASSPSNAGGRLVLSERLGFEKQFDFMKFFAQAFGLTFIVDETTKRLLAYTMDLLYDNIKSGKVIDWSGKVERDPGSSVSFTLGSYARENVIALEENDRDDVTDSASFPIHNQTLAASKELFKISVGAGSDVRVYGNGVAEAAASIPLVELKTPPGKDEEDDPYSSLYEYYLINASFPTIKPHLVELTDRTVPVRPFTVEPLPQGRPGYEYRIANHVPARRLVEMGYSILRDRLLKNAKIVEDKFYLTPEDVEGFDPSVPVYVEKYGAYFYLNKIRNFEIGKLTTCELIKL